MKLVTTLRGADIFDILNKEKIPLQIRARDILKYIEQNIETGDGVVSSATLVGTDLILTRTEGLEDISVDLSSIANSVEIVIFADVAPTFPTNYTFWVDTTSLNMYIKYEDTDSTQWVLVGPIAGGIGNANTLEETYESVSKNLKAYPYAFNYTGEVLTSIVYTTPGGTITKTLNYTGEKLTSIVLSGDTPAGIDLTKTLSYTGETLTNITYT